MATQCVHIIAVNMMSSARRDDVQPPAYSYVKRFFLRQWIDVFVQTRNHLVVMHAMVPEDKAGTYIGMLVKRFETSLPSGPGHRLERKGSLKYMLSSPADKGVSLYSIHTILLGHVTGSQNTFTNRCIMFNQSVERTIGVDPARRWVRYALPYQDNVSARDVLMGLPLNVSTQTMTPEDTAICPNCFDRKVLCALECKHVSCEDCILKEAMFDKGHCYGCGKRSETYAYIQPSSICGYDMRPNHNLFRLVVANCHQTSDQQEHASGQRAVLRSRAMSADEMQS